MEVRQTLLNLLAEYQNDFLTAERFAEFHGLTTEEATELLHLARKVASHAHPEA